MPIDPRQTPEVLRRLVVERAGLSYERFARLIGLKGASSVQRYFTDERSTYLPVEWVRRVADNLAGLGAPPITREEVFELAGPLPTVSTEDQKHTGVSEISLAARELSLYGAKDLPILGQGRAGDDSYVFENGASVRAYTMRPMELFNVRDAYAVYIHGDSMSPRFRHGELAYVDPARPPSPGDDVVIQMHDGQGFIKELVRRTARAVICRQHNPETTLEYRASDVRSIHLIVAATRVRV